MHIVGILERGGVEAVFGDLNGDLRANRTDVDVLYSAIAANQHSAELDLNQNGRTDNDDVLELITDILGIVQGDANFDGDVNFTDFLIFAANFGTNHTWFGGDFDGDGTVTFTDFLILSKFFGSRP